MIKINDKNKLNYYINKYKIDEIFSSNMNSYMELHYFKKNEHICSSEEDSLCLAIPRNIIEKIALKDVHFLSYVCKQLAFKLSSASLSSSMNMLYPLENRLVRYILEAYSTNYSQDENSESLTHISELLGTSYRHLLRVLDKFCSENIIKKSNKTIVILDTQKLENLAGDLYQ